MKSIDALGISPTPWNHETWQSSDDYGKLVKDADGKCICDTSFCENMDANARLMKSAPRLYKALYGILFENAGSVNCRICEGHDCEHCPLGEAHKALEEASEGIVS